MDFRFASDNDDDADITAALAGHLTDFDKNHWRGVNLPSRPGTIAGWVSAEHPDLQTEEALDAEAVGAELYTLYIDRNKTEGGLAFGQLRGWHIVFQVVFISRVAAPAAGFDPCYERVGVGRLFGPDVDTAYQGAESKSLWLC